MAEISIQPNYNTATTTTTTDNSNINSSNNTHSNNNGFGEALKLGRDGFESLLEAQRELIHSQLKDLQKLALRQCQITGTNPLAQEMAAAVLGQNMGKKTGETFTPKALKCLYNVFSIKDTITKKEARDISALTGATVTQVREFFAGQRARVRKVLQLSHGERTSDPSSLSLDVELTIDGAHESGDTKVLSIPKVDAQDSYIWLSNALQQKIDGKELSSAEKAEKLINVMRKEKTFMGQSQLAEIILQAHRAVLRCLMARGGLQQITKWLMQASMEEQTSLIRVLLKALNQFPLGSTLPRQMSLLLQTINKLRFHRAPDVASCARSLLSRWSKFLKTPQNGKIAPSTGLNRISQLSHKHNRDDSSSHVDDDTSIKKSKIDLMVESTRASADVASSSLQIDKPVQPRDESVSVPDIESLARKRIASIRLQGDRSKQKRKVQLVEASVRRRDMDGVRVSTFESTPRPLSADDIRKAKQRAYFLNSSKAQKPLLNNQKSIIPSNLGAPTVGRDQQNIGLISNQEQLLEGVSRNLSSNLTASSSEASPTLREDLMEKSSLTMASVDYAEFPGSSVSDVKLDQDGGQISDVKLEHDGGQLADVKLEQDGEPQPAQIENISGSEVKEFEEPSTKDSSPLTAKQLQDTSFLDSPLIQWVEPPRVLLDPQWRVASGEQSTEIHSQSLRLNNVEEVFYASLEGIPLNPEEPAEKICLFVDDASVPEILLEAIDEESMERDGALQSPNSESGKHEEDGNKVEGTVYVSDEVFDNIKPIEVFSKCQTELELAYSSKLSNDVKEESSLLQLSSGPNHAEPVRMLNGVEFISDVDVLHGNSNGKHVISSTLSQKYNEGKGIKDMSFYHVNNIQNMEHGSVGLEHDLMLPKEEVLVDSLGTRSNIVLPQRENETVSNIRANGFQPSQPVDPCSTTGKDGTGLNISELSPEACAEMLKVVLPQLADNGKGFGADLGLLSVFLKNPELVHTLMSNGPGSNSESSKDLAKKDSNISSQMSNLSIELAKIIAGGLPNETFNAKIGQSVPINPAATQVGEPAFRKPGELASPQLLSLHESQPVHQSIQPKNSQALPLANKDVAIHNRGQDWIDAYGHVARFDEQGTGLSSSSVTWVPSRPAHDRVYTAGEYSQGFQSSNQPIHGRASHPATSSPSIQRGQTSMFMHNGREMNQSVHAVDRQEISLSGRNPQIPYVDLPNQSYTKHRDSGMVVGILPVPEVYHPNHRVQPPTPMHDMHARHAVRGLVPPQVISNSHLNYGHNYHDQKLRPQHILPPPPLPQARPPPSFAANPVRPQMMWSSQSQINRGRHNRLG